MVIHEVNTRIHDRFKQENIEIPFPQRDVHLYNMNPNSSPPLT
jgi:small-conductance mechanosensitive channel